tara:strand:+ start:206 stop:481 length:276 start_codon:yes stop_codon:yes gene_type:complete
MCFGPFAPKEPKVATLPNVDVANRAATDEVSKLPEGKETKTDKDLARVKYGANKKSGAGAAARTGTSALTIGKDVNTGNIAQGSNTTGLNV